MPNRSRSAMLSLLRWSDIVTRSRTARARLVFALAAMVTLVSLYPECCSILCAFGRCPEQSLESPCGRCRGGLAKSGSGLPVHSNCDKHGHLSSVSLPATGRAVASALVRLSVVAVPASALHFFTSIPFHTRGLRLPHGPPGLPSGRRICLRESLLRI